MNSLAIEYRATTEKDIPQMWALMNAQYHIKKNEAYFYWQYFHSYQPSVSIGAFDGNRLIGIFGMQKRKLENGIYAGQAIDLLISPEYRGQGIFSKLGLKASEYFDDIGLLCVLPNKNGKEACEKSLGWKCITQINCFVSHKILKPEEHVIQGNSKERLRSFYSDQQFLEWRFDHHPYYQYRTIHLEPDVFIISKIFKDSIRDVIHGDIVDLYCPKAALLPDLILHSNNVLFEQGVDSVYAWAMKHSYTHEILQTLDFQEFPQERYFCVKILNPDYDHLYDPAQWNLVPADTEFF
jgi:GNAT superfamily N-acetyltransferase